MTLKSKRLYYGLLCDALGMVSLVLPPFDFIWAPLSAFLMARMYKGTEGKVAAVVSFIEEALLGLDFIPSFTLMWMYTYWIKREN